MARANDTIGTTELAEILGVHRNTVIAWIRSKLIRPDHVTLGQRWARFDRASVRAIKKQMKSGARAAA